MACDLCKGKGFLYLKKDGVINKYRCKCLIDNFMRIYLTGDLYNHFEFPKRNGSNIWENELLTGSNNVFIHSPSLDKVKSLLTKCLYIMGKPSYRFIDSYKLVLSQLGEDTEFENLSTLFNSAKVFFITIGYTEIRNSIKSEILNYFISNIENSKDKKYWIISNKKLSDDSLLEHYSLDLINKWKSLKSVSIKA